MLKPITECSDEERYCRALLIIDAIIMLEDFAGQNETLVKIYRIAHAANGCCRGGKCNEDGLKLLEESEVALKELNIIDVEKALKRREKEMC